MKIEPEYTYAYAAVCVASGELDSLILPKVSGACMQIFLDEVANRHPQERIVMVMDGAGWHESKDLMVPANIRIVKLPPYSPELNPVENIWDEIREKYFHNRVFDGISALEDHLSIALNHLESKPESVHSIVAWPWIVNALKN